MDLYHKAEMKKTIDKFFSNQAFASKNVFAFGHCNATEEMIDYLSENNIEVAAILDNNNRKQGNKYRDVIIVAPEYMKKYTASNSLVLVVSRFFESMSAQLRELGYQGEIVKVVEYNSFEEYSLSDDAIKGKTERMLRGAATLRGIREQYPKHHLVICPNCALGDVYWACAYLPAYCIKEKIEHVVVIVVGDGCRQVAEMFGHENIVMLDSTKMDELVQGIIFNHEDNCIIAHHDRPYTDNIIKYLDKNFLDYTDYYKYAVYALSKAVLAVEPLKGAKFNNKWQLIEGKSVIIAPYAKSVVQPSYEFWTGIVNNYHQQGYKIFTNVFGTEEPLAHTQPITLPLNQLIQAAEFAGHFIGLRSGLCDVVRTANCRKTVIMPDCIYSTTNIKVADFFALPSWEQITV